MESRARIIIVCGPICSGKTTFAKQLVEYRHIEVGDIVRDITRTNDRLHIESLDREITQRLIKEVNRGDNVVITGIRQLTILASIISPFIYSERRDEQKPDLVWLDVPVNIRKERYLMRRDLKDNKTGFQKAEELDNKLGLESVEKYLLHSYQYTKIVKNYDYSAL